MAVHETAFNEIAGGLSAVLRTRARRNLAKIIS